VLLPVGNGIAPRRREQHDEERGFLRRELRRRLSEIRARGVANAVEARPELDEIDVERQDFALRERLVQRPCPDHLADFPGDRLFLREVDVLHDLLRDGARAAGEAPFLDVLQQATAPACDHAQGAPARLSWARLLKRVFDIDIEHCPNCGGSLKIIACPEPRRRGRHRRSAGDCQNPRPSGPAHPRPATLPCAAIRFIPDNLRSRKPVANGSRRRRSL
jgi:hypothetical protein